MSTLARSAARTHSARLRTLALAGAAVLTVGLAGCAHYETLESYQPAAGVLTDTPSMSVRNLMVLSSGGQGTLQGALVSDQDDTLTGVTGYELKNDGSQGDALQANVGSVKLPANTAVNLGDHQSAVSGVTPGGMTTLTLNFAKSAPITLKVPVVDPKTMDVSTEAPSAAASNAG